LEAGKNLLPMPATGMIALVIINGYYKYNKFLIKIQFLALAKCGGAFWLKSELFLTKIRTLNSEIQSLGRTKRKGVGGKEFLPALAFPPPPNFVPTKLARRLSNL